MKTVEHQKDFPKLTESLKFRCTPELHKRVVKHAKEKGFSTLDEYLRFIVTASS